MNVKPISVAVLDYQGCLTSAVFGLTEVFTLANRVLREQGMAIEFTSTPIKESVLAALLQADSEIEQYQVVIIPPSIDSQYYLAPAADTLLWLQRQYQQGSIMTCACAGVFMLASAGITDHRPITTHWGLADLFTRHYPHTPVQAEKIIINHGDIISAGGMMAWLDLAFEVVAIHSQMSVVRQLGKLLVVDTGSREQRYYAQFTPRLDHGDELIVLLQRHIQKHIGQPLSLTLLADLAALTQRTLIRRFNKATTLNPTEYIQRVRIQKTCEWLESSTQSFEWIAQQVGYEDAGACRKIFIRVMGLSPSEFRRRFSNKSDSR
ncbi:helix-turn-helix domain-containing protein [Motilimonas sp. 1_MG-2023]|uniref:GlxA family transcriptional regulator n=1 Tax=Motilimonas sp. 1_MG-2023 TaxID=3062672 RepID=UPI0026E2C9D9|nr:helix-turn-helix domain-containing protein [Motilimonas sp. 1_MG-2023]MDO6528015.1 helix-turn-helix domain-containing protein [Motilimonas sp. 1_MG-2023]